MEKKYYSRNYQRGWLEERDYREKQNTIKHIEIVMGWICLIGFFCAVIFLVHLWVK